MNQEIETKHCQQLLRKNNLLPIKRLGKGAFGTVYLVSRQSIQNNKNELLSIKCTSKKNFSKKPMLKRYLRQQIDIQSQMSHNNVVKLIRTFQDQGWNFMIMEYCNMGDIYHYQSQKPKRKLQLKQALKYIIEVLQGLKHLHQNNIIHRDLKSQNILLSRDSQTQEIYAKICDFGFAKHSQQYATTFCGTTYFMAPQIFAKKKYDQSVDIWSAGVIFFHMIFAIYPFKSLNMTVQIESKCNNGFNLGQINQLYNQSVSKQDMNKLAYIFKSIFKITPNERIKLDQLIKYMQNFKKHYQQNQQLSTIQTDADQQLIQRISQKIVFTQKVYQQIKNIHFLSQMQQLLLKYYLDKYCLTLLLANNQLCGNNQIMLKLKKQLQNNQENDNKIILANLHTIQINRFADIYNNNQKCSQNFSTYKQAYRLVLSNAFTKANRLINNNCQRSQIKLKLFCCHSINRVFDEEYSHQIFIHYFRYKNMKIRKTEIAVRDIMEWIEKQSADKINDTIKLLCDKFYRK